MFKSTTTIILITILIITIVTTISNGLTLTVPKRDTFLISFDGILAPTAHFNAKIAIEAALLTWPEELLSPSSSSVAELLEDRTWLLNKMKALSHLSMSEANGIERVMLARLLIEEQVLDQLRSVGKSGKYASKFHPRSMSDSNASNDIENLNGSRPLTVGEISANWEDTLRETLRIRYNVNKKDPFPVMLANLLTVLEQSTNDSICVNDAILYALSECPGDVHILLSSETQCDIAVKHLLSKTSSAFKANIKVNTFSVAEKRNHANSSKNNVPLLAKEALTNTYPQGSIDMSSPTITLTYPKMDSLRLADVIGGLTKDVEDETDVFVICDYNTLLSTKNAMIGAER